MSLAHMVCAPPIQERERLREFTVLRYVNRETDPTVQEERGALAAWLFHPTGNGAVATRGLRILRPTEVVVRLDCGDAESLTHAIQTEYGAYAECASKIGCRLC